MGKDECDFATHPVSEWATQQARNLCVDLAEHAAAVKFLVRDRDTKFTGTFDAEHAEEGVRLIKTQVRAPSRALRGHPRRECLGQMFILGRRHLETVLDEYVERYNSHRPHRSLTSAHRPRPT